VASSQIPVPGNAAEALLHLGRLSLRELSMESLLQTVADLVAGALPGNLDASVTLLVKDAPSTVAFTGQLALDLDETQYQRGHGPCLHAARTGEATEIADTRTDDRWPDYARPAAERGNRSSLSVPLLIDEDERVFGALNLYVSAAGGVRRRRQIRCDGVRSLRGGGGRERVRLPDRPEQGRQPPGSTGHPSGHRTGQRHLDGALQDDPGPCVPPAGRGVDERQPETPARRRGSRAHRRTTRRRTGWRP
jgi:hypothetical protein